MSEASLSRQPEIVTPRLRLRRLRLADAGLMRSIPATRSWRG